MNLEFAEKYFAKFIFAIATTTILLAFTEGFAQLAGRSLIAEMYSPGRLLELAAALLVFVVAHALRQILAQLKWRRQVE